jgi:hypothetical protein
MKKRVHLAVWMGRDQQADPARLTLADLLYAPPNPDMTRKRCGNCLLWLGDRGDQETPGREECFIHASDVVVLGNMVCGYHVFGTPMGAGATLPPREGMQPVTAELSGLCQPEDGSSCEVCAHYRSTGRTGVCAVAYEDDVDDEGDAMNAVVQPNGCCAAWRELPDETS